jgi:hypothetical protein
MPNASELNADDLDVRRRNQFCTALPFPDLKWGQDGDTEKNLAELHDFARQLANSAIDWYLQKKRGKKAYARCFHTLTYISGGLAVLVPLIMILIPESSFVAKYFGNLRSFAAEAALVFLGIAGAWNLIDRAAGFSADWMRYIVTVTCLCRELAAFEFDWMDLTRKAYKRPEPPGPPPGTPPPPVPPQASQGQQQTQDKAPDDLDSARVELAKKFSLRVLEVTGEETSVWAKELRDRLSQMVRDFRQSNQP